MNDGVLDEMLRDSPSEDEEVTGSAANIAPELEPEPEKTPEPTENVMKPTAIGEGREIPMEIITPHPILTRQQNPRTMKKMQGR